VSAAGCGNTRLDVRATDSGGEGTGEEGPDC